jgi:hypothetical protein
MFDPQTSASAERISSGSTRALACSGGRLVRRLFDAKARRTAPGHISNNPARQTKSKSSGQIPQKTNRLQTDTNQKNESALTQFDLP